MTAPSGDLAAVLETMPYAVALGMVLDAATPDEVVGTLAWAPERCTAGGLMHGGALMTLADSVGAVCAFLNLPVGSAGTATTSSSTNLFRGVRDGTVTATSRPLHRGRTLIVVQTDLTDDSGRRVAQVTQSQAVLPAPAAPPTPPA
jgi:uncharacterized protein (TIGR00369 family)